MGMNTLRDNRWSRLAQQGLRIQWPGRPAASGQARPRNPQAATYWRRRCVALLIGLALLALIAWAFSGAIGGGAPAGTSGGSAQSGAGQGSGSGHGGSGQGGAAPAGTGSRGGSAQGSGTGPGSGKAAGKTGGGAAAAGSRPCHHGQVVLSLSSSQESYGAGQLPQFKVFIVSTARETCTFNAGAAHVALVIRDGPGRVWSSADCVQGSGDLILALQRGTPTELPISWNRQESSHGCPASSAQVPTGTYTATVSDGTLTSNSVTFKLS
jgi:hypothetical protein